jgi:tetratricopeptide (TPR) repeat protein
MALLPRVGLRAALFLSPLLLVAGEAAGGAAESEKENHPVDESIALIEKGAIKEARGKLESFRKKYCGPKMTEYYSHPFLDRQRTHLYLALCYSLLGRSSERNRALKDAFAVINIAWGRSWDSHTRAFVRDTTTLSKTWTKRQQGGFYAMLGVLYTMWGKTDRALAAATTAATVDATNADRAQDAAEVFLMHQKFEESVRWFRKAAALKPESADVHSTLGALQSILGNSGEAILHLQKAMALDEDRADIRVNLILAYSAAGQYKKAERLYTASISRFPKSAQLLNTVSLYYLVGSRDYQEADAVAQRLGATYMSQQPTALVLHAAAMMGLKREEEAKSMMRQVIKREPRAGNKEFLMRNWSIRGHALDLLLPIIGTTDR